MCIDEDHVKVIDFQKQVYHKVDTIIRQIEFRLRGKRILSMYLQPFFFGVSFLARVWCWYCITYLAVIEWGDVHILGFKPPVHLSGSLIPVCS